MTWCSVRIEINNHTVVILYFVILTIHLLYLWWTW